MRYFFYLTATLALLFTACKKEPKEDPRKDWFLPELWDALQKADFGCQGIYAENYLSATLDSGPFCINAQDKDTSFAYVSQSVSVGTNGVTSLGFNHVFAVGDMEYPYAMINKYSPSYVLEHKELDNEVTFSLKYLSPRKHNLDYLLDSVLEVGKAYPINKDQEIINDPHAYWTIDIGIIYRTSFNVQSTTATIHEFYLSANGPQSSGAHVKIAEVKKREFPDHFLYDVTFEFTGELYSGTGAHLWTTMKDGKMKGTFTVKK